MAIFTYLRIQLHRNLPTFRLPTNDPTPIIHPRYLILETELEKLYDLIYYKPKGWVWSSEYGLRVRTDGKGTVGDSESDSDSDVRATGPPSKGKGKKKASDRGRHNAEGGAAYTGRTLHELLLLGESALKPVIVNFNQLTVLSPQLCHGDQRPTMTLTLRTRPTWSRTIRGSGFRSSTRKRLRVRRSYFIASPTH